MRSPLGRWTIRLLSAGVIAGALAYIPYRVYGSEGYVRYRRLAAEEQRLDRANQALRDDNRALRLEVRRLRDDLDAVGAVARHELGMVAPGEIVVQLPGGGAP